MFGARYREIEFLQEMTASDALDFLLDQSSESLAPPIGVKDDDDEIPIGTTWTNTKYNSKFRGQRIYSYNNWWINRLINQDVSLVEKMTLFFLPAREK